MARDDLVGLADPETGNGLAHMLASLLQQNVAERPQKAALLTSMRRTFTIIGSDMGLIVTLRFSRDGVTVHDGIEGAPHIIIIADSETLLDLTRLKVLYGAVPVMWDEVGRSVFDKMRKGELVIKGALPYLKDFGRFAYLMSVNS
jgi:hypothetical protein